jgi:hypothetical protein
MESPLLPDIKFEFTKWQYDGTIIVMGDFGAFIEFLLFNRLWRLDAYFLADRLYIFPCLTAQPSLTRGMIRRVTLLFMALSEEIGWDSPKPMARMRVGSMPR